MPKKKSDIGLIIFELTNACNLACKFCYNHWKGSDATNAIIPSNYKQARKTLKTLFSQAEVNSISFSGGEPMLMNRIYDLLLFARMNKANVSLLSNGTLLTDTDLEVFEHLALHRIQIPILSSDSTIHDSITQQSGSWQKSVNAIKKLLSINAEKVNAVLILTRQNLDTLPQTLDLYKNLGVKSVLLNRFNIGGLGRKYKDELELTHDELRSAFAKINNFARNSGIRFFSGVCTPICVLKPEDYPEISFSFCNLNISTRPITINYLGDLRFCNHSPRVLGNIHQKSIKDILSDADQSGYFNSIPSKCAQCEHFYICKGGCRAASEQLWGNFADADPILVL